MATAEELYRAYGWSGCAGAAWDRLAPATREGWEYAARMEAERDSAKERATEELASESFSQVVALRQRVEDMTNEMNNIRTDWAALVNRALAAERERDQALVQRDEARRNDGNEIAANVAQAEEIAALNERIAFLVSQAQDNARIRAVQAKVIENVEDLTHTAARTNRHWKGHAVVLVKDLNQVLPALESKQVSGFRLPDQVPAMFEWRVVLSRPNGVVEEVGVGPTETKSVAHEDFAGWKADGFEVKMERRRVGPWEQEKSDVATQQEVAWHS